MTASPVPLSDDAAAQRLSALHAECFDEAWDAPAIARLLSMPGAFAYWAAVSAETGESPDGFVLARVGGGEAEILTICVRPAARAAGLGRVLLAAAAAHAAAAGAGSLFLEVAEDNMPALRLYESFGFSLVGMRPGYYERGSSRVAARTLKLDLPRDASPVINP
ncbi:MAG: GNAT family N-acetyltransferase [Parvibaculum sp.]